MNRNSPRTRLSKRLSNKRSSSNRRSSRKSINKPLPEKVVSMINNKFNSDYDHPVFNNSALQKLMELINSIDSTYLKTKSADEIEEILRKQYNTNPIVGSKAPQKRQDPEYKVVKKDLLIQIQRIKEGLQLYYGNISRGKSPHTVITKKIENKRNHVRNVRTAKHSKISTNTWNKMNSTERAPHYKKYNNYMKKLKNNSTRKINKEQCVLAAQEKMKKEIEMCNLQN